MSLDALFDALACYREPTIWGMFTILTVVIVCIVLTVLRLSMSTARVNTGLTAPGLMKRLIRML